MQRIAPVDLKNTDAKTEATLNAIKSKLGMLPNLFTTLAHAPAALAGYLQLTETLARGHLNEQQREMIAIAIAQENACEYCLSAHAAIGRSAGLDDADIRLARNGEAGDARDAAVTDFALRVVRSRATVTDEELVAARAAGLEDALIIEIIVHVALNILTNYVNRVAGTEVDFPLVALSSAA